MFCSMPTDHPVRPSSLAALFILLAFLAPASAQEDFILRSDATQSTVSISVLPFEGMEKIPQLAALATPHKVLQADLEFSKRFQVVPPPAKGWDSASVAQKALAALAYGIVLPGSGKDEIVLKMRMVDASSREALLEKNYSGRPRDLRRLVHRFSDDMVFQMFGERGIATTRIAFVRGKPGHKEIWTMDYDGFGAEPWTKNGSINLSPTWDRDGGLIWSSYAGGGAAKLWRQTPGQKAHPLLPSVPGMQISASTSPLDGEVAMATSLDGQTEIWRGQPEGRPVRLTYSPDLEVSPSWSPNGWQIAFTSDRTGHPQVYVMDREGSGTRRLTWTGQYNDQPSWSPGGDRIAFARMAGGFQILTISPDGSDERWLGPGEQPKWSPDGRHIVFTRAWEKSSDIWVCEADGSNPRALTFFGDAAMPAWSR